MVVSAQRIDRLEVYLALAVVVVVVAAKQPTTTTHTHSFSLPRQAVLEPTGRKFTAWLQIKRQA